jgi:hypothetical protein
VRTGVGPIPGAGELGSTEIFGFDTGTRTLSAERAAEKVIAVALAAVDG